MINRYEVETLLTTTEEECCAREPCTNCQPVYLLSGIFKFQVSSFKNAERRTPYNV